MITEILKTLSDGELMAIAEQLADPTLDEQLIYRQVTAKGNLNETLCDINKEMNSDDFRGTLPRLVALELSNRYRELVKSI